MPLKGSPVMFSGGEIVEHIEILEGGAEFRKVGCGWKFLEKKIWKTGRRDQLSRSQSPGNIVLQYYFVDKISAMTSSVDVYVNKLYMPRKSKIAHATERLFTNQ